MAVRTFIFRSSQVTGLWCQGLAGDPDRQGLVTFDKTRIHPLGFIDHLNISESLENLFPDDLELQLGQPDSDAAMDAEAERNVGTWPGAVNDEIVGAFDHVLVTIARDVPHHDLVALFDLPAAELDIFERGAAH